MAQSYFPPFVTTAPSAQEEPSSSKSPKNVQEAFVIHRDRLVNAIDSTKKLLGDLSVFNKEGWTIRYPQFREQAEEVEHGTAEAMKPKRRGAARRSLSFADDPTVATEVVFKPSKNMRRSMTLAAVADIPEEKMEEPAEELSECLIPSSQTSDFHVLRLDLKMGPHGSSTAPGALVSQLEKASIAKLVDERIGSSVNHIDKLRTRILDTASKVLVTGDLNAGKSTFVNAVLRREVMPVDQQPCTTAFCEVHDASENGGVEEVHLVQDGTVYSVNDESTFKRASLADLEDIVGENENDQMKMKVYLCDTTSPEKSLLNNGIVDISLIDAPGLNRDSIKTTALFARQEEIDVVVFVVSAENHFTLSAKEFLWTASQEKAYVFIVVNKFAHIRNKDKCRRLVLEQIKQLSPNTYENADELVHFVDSGDAVDNQEDMSFAQLQTSLRSFVLEKREKSKLAPASTYLSHLLSDLELLVGSNAIVAQGEQQRAEEDLKRTRPILAKMKSGRDSLNEGLEALEESGVVVTSSRTKQLLDAALNRLSQGKVGSEGAGVRMPSYPGLLNVWDYVADVRRTLLASMDAVVSQAEEESRATAVAGVDAISKLGDERLPEGVQPSKRVFIPEAMFVARANKQARRASGAVGASGVGLGLAQRSELLESTFLDIFDGQHQFHAYFGNEDEGQSKSDEETGVTAISAVSVGVGLLTMVGGKAMGLRGLIEGVLRLSDLWQNESARKWAAPILGATVIGATAYVVFELPESIPRNVGRRIRHELAARPAAECAVAEEGFVDMHAVRISRETRKVLRLASWDLKQRYTTAMEEHGKEVKDAEDREHQSKVAVAFFREVERKTGEVRQEAGLVTSTL